MTAPETFFVPAAPGTKLAICHRESQRIDLLPLLGWVHPTGTESATGSPVVALGGQSWTLGEDVLAAYEIADAFCDSNS